MTTCDYRHKYQDYVKESPEIFSCDETALESGKCKFHDEEYVHNHKTEITELIKQKIEESIEHEIPILCIGYKIPDIEFKNKEISTIVDFSNTKFLNNVIFDNCIF